MIGCFVHIHIGETLNGEVTQGNILKQFKFRFKETNAKWVKKVNYLILKKLYRLMIKCVIQGVQECSTPKNAKF